jgi:transposase-like protein
MNEDQPTETTAATADSAVKPLGDVIAINEGLIKDHLDKMVVKTVEETLNAMLDAEAEEQCGAMRYERTPDRLDNRDGHYDRQLHTKAGEVTLKVPRLRKLPFESAIIEQYKRLEISVEKALAEPRPCGKPGRVLSDGPPAAMRDSSLPNRWTAVPMSKVREVAGMLKAVHAQEDLQAARGKAVLTVTKLRELKLASAAEIVATGVEKTLRYFHFSSAHWRSLRTNNPLERLMREIRHGTRAVGVLPDKVVTANSA